MDSTFRPMSMAQLLDRTISLYRRNFLLFFGIFFLPSLLPLTMQLVTLAAIYFGRASFGPEGIASLYLRVQRAGAPETIANTVAFSLATFATVHAIISVEAGKPLSIWKCFTKLRPDAGRITPVSLILCLLVSLPSIVVTILIFGVYAMMSRIVQADDFSLVTRISWTVIAATNIAGVLIFYALARFSLVLPVCILEKLPAGEAFRRTKALIRGRIARAFGIFLLMFVMIFGITLVLRLPVHIANFLFLKGQGPRPGPAAITWMRLSQVFARVLAAPVAGISMVLLYYDERVHKEALDLQLMIEAVRRNR